MDLRRNENYGAGANLTPEQALWSESWDFLCRLQAGRVPHRASYAGLMATRRLRSGAVAPWLRRFHKSLLKPEQELLAKLYGIGCQKESAEIVVKASELAEDVARQVVYSLIAKVEWEQHRRSAFVLGEDFLPADEALLVTMIPMPTKKSNKLGRLTGKNVPARSDASQRRPVRLQTAVVTFHRDASGRAVAGGPTHVLLDVDASKHPMQDHPVVKQLNYDPRRGQKTERYGAELFGQSTASGVAQEIRAPLGGRFSTSTETPSWQAGGQQLIYLIDGEPMFRFPAAASITAVATDGDVVEKGAVLGEISASEPFDYHRTSFSKDLPDLDESCVFSPMDGDLVFARDDIYVNVYVKADRFTTLVARFLNSDVAAGNVILTAEREIKGVGVRNLDDLIKPLPRAREYRLRKHQWWTPGFPKEVRGDEDRYLIARLVSPCKYGLAVLRKGNRPIWDRIHGDVFPASKPKFHPALRLVGRALQHWAGLSKPVKSEYPPAMVEESWPKPYATFSGAELDRLGDMEVSPELEEAARKAVSPDGDMALRFVHDGEWIFTGCDEDLCPEANTLFFRAPKTAKAPSSEDSANDDVVPGMSWEARRLAIKAATEASAADAPAPPPVHWKPGEPDEFSMRVPASAVLRKKVEEGEVVTRGEVVADWMPRRYYTAEELWQLVGNNKPWFVSALLQHVAVLVEHEDKEQFALPDSYVPQMLSQDRGLVLRQSEQNEAIDGVVLFTPQEVSGQGDIESFTWSVNGIFYDLVPNHLVVEPAPSKKAGGRKEEVVAK